ncbi:MULTISPECIES: hypothetical protein [Paenibacillus]|uniref:hypothetical protein n=1 Tax=Paenibacillus TaxID=44249 RepID=UPI000F703BB3|nr:MULTISPECIES: hypothetical protein [Paenibacillus]AZH28739.1 hypothetical protein EGM68_08165 [Paenibacillus sp. M-152]RTZ37893.1 hypothetical protein EJ573_01405 [Paenibacillus polymyxa]WDM23804.1 hypothetical protein J4I02_10105 [Paenibacillus polymyxa]
MSTNDKLFEHQVNRNLKGIELEKKGEIVEAILLYEANVSECFEGNHPYDRLRTIYNRLNRYKDVIRVLEQAVYVFDAKVNKLRADRLPKLTKFIDQLEKAKNKYS